MRRKKVLFIPNSMPSHIIPLIALANSLNKDRFESAFLLTKLYREHVEMYGYPFFLITRREKKEPGTETDAEFVESLAVELDEEVKAITAYDPDVWGLSIGSPRVIMIFSRAT